MEPNEGVGQAQAERVTQLLNAAPHDAAAASALLPLVYDHLRAIARRRMSGERTDHTLQATALVHEAYLKLVDERAVPWKNRVHFLAAAAQAMRYVLLDHARARGRVKRGGGRRVSLDVAELSAAEDGETILALDEAFTRLESESPDLAEVARLRVYGGLTGDEVASALGISPRTIDRRWKLARAWLRRELGDGAAEESDGSSGA